MHRLAPGVAHISFVGGSAFLPLHSPYDKEILVEHVTETARTRGLAQLLIGAARWLVRARAETAAIRCAGCGNSVGTVACLPPRGGATYCVGCAVEGVPAVAIPLRMPSAA